MTTGYDGSDELLRVAETIDDLACDIRREMEIKKSASGRGNRRTED